MNIIRPVFLLSLIISTIIASTDARALNVPSRVTDVVIYSEGAMVTRGADVALSEGEQQLILQGLPSAISAEALQVELGDGSVQVGQVNLKSRNLRDPKDPAIISLNNQIMQVKQSLAALTDATKSAELQLKFLDSLATGYSKQAWIGSAQASADTASWQRALELMQQGSSAAYATLRENQAKSVELNKDLDVLMRELNDKRGNRKSANTLTINVNAARATNTKLKIHYYQDDASWAPAYESRLDSATSRLTIIQKAVIEQSTEEAWDNVKVTLSTSEPSGDMQAPDVSSTFLDIYTPPKVSRKEAVGYSSSGSQLEEVVVTASRRQNEWSGSYALNYPIAGKISVSNDQDDVQRYDLRSFGFDVDLVTQAVPRVEAQAYLAARLVNDGPVPIYASEMLVYVDNVLMGTTDMPNILPGAEVALPMGQDRRIEVKVSDVGAQGGEVGLMKRHRSKATNLVYEITNRRSSPSELEIRDFYPVSKNKSVKVEIDKDATPPTQRNEDDKAGVMVWRKRLEPGETWRINYRYTVTYPAGKNLQQVYSSY